MLTNFAMEKRCSQTIDRLRDQIVASVRMRGITLRHQEFEDLPPEAIADAGHATFAERNAALWAAKDMLREAQNAGSANE